MSTKTQQRQAEIGDAITKIVHTVLTFFFGLVVDWARDNVDKLPELLNVAKRAAAEKAAEAGEWAKDSIEGAVGVDLDGDGKIGRSPG